MVQEHKEMKKVPISEIHSLDNFDIVKIINDETQEFVGYFLNSKYKKPITELSEKIVQDKQ